MTQSKIPLSKRLKKIYDAVPDCNCFADIGTDHAYLPVYMCASGKCRRAVASDIVAGPLERAKATVLKYGMSGKISLRLGPGVSTLDIGEADVVSIAGMGGLIIADILEQGRNILCQTKKIILQPMTAAADLREYLYKNDWEICEELLVKDNNKIYNILSVISSNKRTDSKMPTDIDIYIGRLLIENKPDLYSEYLKTKILKLEKKITGLKKSNSDESIQTIIECTALLDKIKKLLEESHNV